MCWQGTVKDIRKAKTNITVYKVLRKMPDGFYIAPYRSELYTYEFGMHYSIESLGIKREYEYVEINEGFHCYSPNAYAYRNDDKGISVCVKRKYSYPQHSPDGKSHWFKGINSFKYHSPIHIYATPVVVKCTIPKGATYYINSDSTIVTTDIIIDKVMGTPKNLIDNPMKFRDIDKQNLFESIIWRNKK